MTTPVLLSSKRHLDTKSAVVGPKNKSRKLNTKTDTVKYRPVYFVCGLTENTLSVFDASEDRQFILNKYLEVDDACSLGDRVIMKMLRVPRTFPDQLFALVFTRQVNTIKVLPADEVVLYSVYPTEEKAEKARSELQTRLDCKNAGQYTVEAMHRRSITKTLNVTYSLVEVCSVTVTKPA